jgi:hypothetical protein
VGKADPDGFARALRRRLKFCQHRRSRTIRGCEFCEADEKRDERSLLIWSGDGYQVRLRTLVIIEQGYNAIIEGIDG